ncbi:MAG: hypothetical protein LIO74_00770 [Ruminococcus sp.]|nr:hypothetical protein [Ruminococcus sp.]
MANTEEKLEQQEQVQATEVLPTETEAEQTEQMDGIGFGAPSTVYPEEEWEQQRVKSWPRQIHVFGTRQNQVNRGTAARLRTLEIENRTLKLKMEQLEKELEAVQVREKKSLGRVAVMIDRMQAELDRVRLSNQLNSNAVDRLMKRAQEEDEAALTEDIESTDATESDE